MEHEGAKQGKPAKKSRRPARSIGLSPAIYIVRNPGRTLPMMLILLLSVVLVASVVSLLDSIEETIKHVYGYNRYFAVIVPRSGDKLSDDLVRRAMSAPNIQKRYNARATIMMVKTIVGRLPFAVFGLKRGEMEDLSKRIGLELKSGTWPAAGKPEMAISTSVARNLNAHIGSVLLSPDAADSYAPMPVKVVGILEGDEWFACTSYNFVKQNFLLSVDDLLVSAPNPREQAALDAWLVEHMHNTPTRVWVYREVEQETAAAFKTLYMVVDTCIGMLVVLIALMMGLLANIYFTQRMVEFGLLQAIGFTRRELLVRVMAETTIVVSLGWLLGAAATFGSLCGVRYWFTEPRGLLMDPAGLRAYAYTLPIPIFVAISAFATLVWRLARFDPVAIVERRLV